MVLAYLSAPIIHDTLRKDDFCSIVIEAMEDNGVTVFAPQLMEAHEPGFIYSRDIEHVRMCDLLIAEVSSPSLGVGMEIMLAIELMKPVLMFLQSNSDRISKMVLGADGKVLFRYKSLKEVDQVLRSFDAESLIVHKCAACDSQVAEILDDKTRCIACGHTGRNSVV
jgi:nucleoside 2-deoxyribosyltransferase